MSEKKLLPLGIQTFADFKALDCYYVDKTAYIEKMVKTPGRFKFLSRPRRFGKSLLVSTMDSLFSGKKELFEGLAVYDTWDWTKNFPVLHFDLSGNDVKTRIELRKHLGGMLDGFAEDWDLVLKDPLNFSQSFRQLFKHIFDETGKKIVILIDEYDDPISSNRHKPEIAEELRDELRGFYKNFKALDKYIHFGFLTGVTKFSHLNLFSGLNNLIDISLYPEYNAICGYTEKEVIETFKDEFRSLKIETLREWYNGYSWDGVERVYNPLDLLLAFDRQQYAPFWIKTGSSLSVHSILENDPTFLDSFIEKFKDTKVSGPSMEPVGFGQLNVNSLLFQTGYLTTDRVEHEEVGESNYYLRVPNQEVEIALSSLVVSYLSKIENTKCSLFASDLRKALKNNNFESFIELITALYAGIPHNAYRKNNMYTYEGFYAVTFIFLMCAVVGKHIYPEDVCATGQADLTVVYNNCYYIFEFKVVDDEPKEEALQQIIDKNYAAKYRADGKPIYLIGIEFSKKTRTIAWHKIEQDEAE